MLADLGRPRTDGVAQAKKQRWMATGALLLLAAGMAWLFAEAPGFVDFALAVAVAVSWCVWLERHPEPSWSLLRTLDAAPPRDT